MRSLISYVPLELLVIVYLNKSGIFINTDDVISIPNINLKFNFSKIQFFFWTKHNLSYVIKTSDNVIKNIYV